MRNSLPMAQAHSPTIRARRLGKRLHDLRDTHQLDVKTVAARLRVSHMTIRRLEHGLTKADLGVLQELLDLYGVTTTERLELIHLAENAFRRGWWLEYGDVLDDTFVLLEDEASEIFTWQSLLVPGLLQIDAYARALFEVWPRVGPATSLEHTTAEVERRVKARRSRRDILDRPGGPRLHAVLGEAALRQEVGDAETMRDQLAYMVKMASREDITLQVLPYSAGAHPGLSGPFSIFEFEHSEDPAVAHTENLSGSAYPESAEALNRFRLTWGSVTDAALPPQESASMIEALIAPRGDQTA